MCDADETTREHVPPKSFFPKGYRENLVTVPSCSAHNNDLSMDVEYVRNIISPFNGTNTMAEMVFEATKRSFDHSPKLLHRAFGDIRPIDFNGEKVGIFSVDLARIDSVMRAIASAVHLKEYGKKYVGQWQVFVASTKSQEDLNGQLAPWQEFRLLLASLQFVQRPVPQPKVFEYSISLLPDGLVFKFAFYQGFIVYCFGPKAERTVAA
jgi:hypothetical protein